MRDDRSASPVPSGALPGVVGHDAARQRLAQAISRGQLHHALVLAGPAGIGKATLARALAVALHCPEVPGRGCGTCRTCTRLHAGTHTGFEWLVPEGAGGKISIERARELRTRLLGGPVEGRVHVVAIDPADALSDAAQNALLKSIEEPREGVFFVLVTTSLQRLLPTILSRSLVVRLGRLSDAEVRTIVTAELPGLSPDAVTLAASLSGGSAGLAIELARDTSLGAIRAVLRMIVMAVLAGPPAIFGAAARDLWSAFETATSGPATGKPARERRVLRRLLELWLLDLRQRMRDQPGLEDLASISFPTARAAPSIVAVVLRWLEGLEQNPNVRLSIEQHLLELSSLARRST